ncbi:RING finger protein [Endozoicomonas sp. SCSIO W0465]|uniref:RING finger protein n=1 Tax=Endozoicomonas sp. SCSIO W0465 TaxID=2918516 RepID=UPI0035322429
MQGITSANNPNNQQSLNQLPADNCSICHSAFAGCEVRVTGACNHKFHVICLRGWLSSNTTCPLCKREVQPASAMPDHPEPLEDKPLDRELIRRISEMCHQRGGPNDNAVNRFLSLPAPYWNP